MARQGLIELEAVLAIAARGSFRAAALELGLSTTALSNAIGKLERELGVRVTTHRREAEAYFLATFSPADAPPG